MSKAIGMIEVEGVAGIVAGADAACKAARVELMGWESIGGFTTLFLRGPLGDVGTALRAGEAAAGEVTGHVVSACLDQPRPECSAFVGCPLPAGEVEATALGLIETRGYGVHLEVDDLMVKAADVAVANVLTVHDRVVCSLVTGPVDGVEQAIDRGRERLAGSEGFMASAVIPQPLPSVLRAFVLFRPAAGAG